MVSGTSKEAVRPALVLTWDATTTRVLCPYRCSTKIHSHGTIMPREDFINSRAAHCGPDDIGHDRQYRLVYPFEDDQTTSEMFLWWELDRKHRRWRIVGWNAYDPAYENAGVVKDYDSCSPEEHISDSYGEIGSAVEELARGLGSIGLNDDHSSERQPQMDEMDETDEFIIHCLLNEEVSARAMLNSSSSLKKLVCSRSTRKEKEVLYMACEEGHLKIVDPLLEFGAVLEVRDCEGNTPLLSAINYGRISVVSRLI